MIKKIKLACPFKIHLPQAESISEFNIKYSKDSTVEDLLAFVQEYDKDYRINVEFTDTIDYSVCRTIDRISDNVYVRLKAKDVSSVDKVLDTEVKFFFDASVPAFNKTHLDDMMQMGVSDVYIADDLCYDLDNVSTYCRNNGIKLRAVLNRIPSTSMFKGDDPRNMFFCPIDLDGLSRYYDMFEFDCGEPYQWNIFNVLYRTWFTRGNWNGDLREINPDLKFFVPNNALLHEFTYFKTKCRMKCVGDPKTKCHKCDQIYEIAKLLTEKGFRFKVVDEKKNNEST